MTSDMDETSAHPPLPRSIAELPSVDRSGVGHLSMNWSRRQLFRRAFTGAMAVSLMSLDLLPPARRAYADHVGTDGYQIKDLPCPDYASGHNCKGCGDSHICGNSSSGPCCVPGGEHRTDWHKAGPSCTWRLRKNGCVDETGWDGWKWAFGGDCGCCGGGVKVRCHDGYQFNPDDCTMVRKTICKAVLACEPPYPCI